jgi:hypothetical protein
LRIIFSISLHPDNSALATGLCAAEITVGITYDQVSDTLVFTLKAK